MAKFMTTVQDRAVEVLTEFMAEGRVLTIHRAAIGDGVADVSPNTLTDLVHALDSVDVSVGASEFVDVDTPYMKVPVQVTNAFLEAPVYVREVGIYARDGSNQEFLFARSYLIGDDSDNVLPAVSNPDDDGDTVHIHDMAVVLTTAQAASVTVEIGSGSFVTESRMRAYAAPLGHTQAATTVSETTGETTEVVNRRQDYDIAAIKEQMDTGFSGTTVTHNFSAAQLANWTGYDGTGLPEGILNASTNSLYL